MSIYVCNFPTNFREYDAATQEDLFASLSAQIEEDLTETSTLPKGTSLRNVMETWTLQPGYPVVTVTVDRHRETVVLRQVTSSTATIKSYP